MLVQAYAMRLSDLEAAATRLISGRDRRDDERFAMEIPVQAIVSHPDGISAMLREGVVEDVNERGAALRLDIPVKKGWLVRMSLSLGMHRIDVQGRVVRR